MSHTPGRRFCSAVFYTLTVIMLSCLFTACSTNKRVSYFRNVPDSLYRALAIEQSTYSDPKILPNDILQISIQTIDTKTSSELQGAQSPAVSAMSNGTGGTAPSITGFLVDKDGNVAIPLVGKLKLGGLTTAEARDLITQKVAVYYREPVVNVRLANFNITVLGEVNKPGSYVVTNEKISLLDAIGVAGDLTIYGKRENVMLIREENHKKVFVRFNLNSSDIFMSPYFFLKQGDVVYVEPNKARTRFGTADPTRDRIITFSITAMSLVVAIFTAVNNYNR